MISSGSIDRIKEKAAEFGLDRVVLRDDDSLFDAVREVALGIASDPPHQPVGPAAR